MLAAVAIFALTYYLISGGRLPWLARQIDRPTAALAGGVAMVLVGAVTARQAAAAINLDTLLLLFGMLTLAAALAEAGFFRALAAATVRRARTPRRLLCALVLLAGGLAALLVNDTICVMLTPLVVAIVEETGLDPLPFLLALGTATNIGGVVTLTGNPQNMIVGTLSGLTYRGYLLRMLPVGVAGLALDAALLCWLFRRALPAGRELTLGGPGAMRVAPLAVSPMDAPGGDRPLARKALAVLASVALAFALGAPLAGAAVAGGAAVLLLAGGAARRVLARVDFPLLVFFAGLFVVVEGLARSGGFERCVLGAAALMGRRPAHQLAAFAVLTTLGSNLVSNVPFVLIGAKAVPSLLDPPRGWIVLAMASTLAGNLTIFGSVANLIVLESAGPHGRVGFWRFLRYGAPITAATLGLGVGAVLLEARLGL